MSYKSRTCAYWITLILTLFEMVFTAEVAIMKGRAPHIAAFGFLATAAAFLTSICVVTLLSFHNKAYSRRRMTTAYVHFLTFTILAVTWFTLSIILTSQAPYECQKPPTTESTNDPIMAPIWCGMAMAATLLAWLVFISASASVVIVYLPVRHVSDGLHGNVAGQDLVGEELYSSNVNSKPSMAELPAIIIN
ncbi:hypothetical protein DFH07DRAFT_1065191 [Mycena maculata]|uniref:MARVEL domain-containing protein n=1 Tax=Mycena maculata TaxID=230809 RepID=A0AAD7MW65_9AGAR|nr:hypothetical protein DFH07DRAFT_1065191 [Mycena maculata]